MTQELTISGMHCHHCVHAVREALSRLSGVDVLDVEIGKARIRTSGGQDEAISAALDEEGYSLVDMKAG
jgi:copper chaperone CopZ